MLFRAIALSLALLVGIGTIIPFVTDSTEAGPKHKKKKHKKLKKYSKAWWKWYKKQQRKKRALLARKRALRAKQILLARQRANKAKEIVAKRKIEKPAENMQTTNPKPVKTASVKTSKENQPTNSELFFRVKDDTGAALGTASLSIIGSAKGDDSQSGANKIGGVPTSALRRNVVDKMVKEEGWVVNDYTKIVNGKKVYVVIAQSSLKGVVQSRMFYFTEVSGRIYSLSTTGSTEVQEQIAKESEKLIQSLQRGNSIAQIGKVD